MDQQKEPSQDRSAGAACPECGTPRAADNTPSCACGTRASDALRDARTAQAAAAEDFDPLRIRPYVELDGAGKPTDAPDTSDAPAAPDASGSSGASDASGSSGSSGERSAASGSDSDPDATMMLRAVGAGAGAGAGTGMGAGASTSTGAAAAGAGAGSPVGDAEATSALPTPLAPSTGSPSAHDLRLFDASATAPLPQVGPGAESAGSGGRPPRRRRKGVLLSAAGAVVVVVGAAGFASGLFSYDTPSRDGALPDEVRASVPDPSTSEAPPSAGPSTTTASPTPSASASPSESASPSAEPSASASPSPSASSASPTPSRSAEPTQSTSAPAEDAPQESEEDDGDPGGGPTLRRGDQGPEVVELQQRLKEKWMYWGDLNGNYNRQVEDAVRQYQWESGIHTDGPGVYGPETRRRLESETR
ncbi:peptidoglycan-binding protein [Streptomyces sp. RS2]|uniref:peptidoglycan-binding domain-containing protein n=1 Tax=Streptomyces TaxID=1883 RepID=UPI0021F8AC3E|nr:peptidoglycan-binding domain-containing protein [Streptomyces sp. RS2]MCW1093743.1 peptidoglycan-binding protein [Streptomyces sp. RS2]